MLSSCLSLTQCRDWVCTTNSPGFMTPFHTYCPMVTLKEQISISEQTQESIHRMGGNFDIPDSKSTPLCVTAIEYIARPVLKHILFCRDLAFSDVSFSVVCILYIYIFHVHLINYLYFTELQVSHLNHFEGIIVLKASYSCEIITTINSQKMFPVVKWKLCSY